jgi:hypothetical protein
MKTPHMRKRVVCATAAVLLTGLSSMVFVSAEPRLLESRLRALGVAGQVAPSYIPHGQTAQTAVVKFPSA